MRKAPAGRPPRLSRQAVRGLGRLTHARAPGPPLTRLRMRSSHQATWLRNHLALAFAGTQTHACEAPAPAIWPALMRLRMCFGGRHLRQATCTCSWQKAQSVPRPHKPWAKKAHGLHEPAACVSATGLCKDGSWLAATMASCGEASGGGEGNRAAASQAVLTGGESLQPNADHGKAPNGVPGVANIALPQRAANGPGAASGSSTVCGIGPVALISIAAATVGPASPKCGDRAAAAWARYAA
mmetsp:Transcript_78036/g.225675  ORF Transcript_78036/g.225675 Transcript_78036/m.225675 type:complete len:241 (-) Transcript_78036:827-1549(-)